MNRVGWYSMEFEKGARLCEVEAALALAIETHRGDKPSHIVMHMDDIDRIIREEPVKRCENRLGLYFEIDGVPVAGDRYFHPAWP